MNTMLFRTLLRGIAVSCALLAPPVLAHGPLLNLTEVPNNFPIIAEGDRRCPTQSYFRYVGGNPDAPAFAGPVEPAYPSPNLLYFMTNTVPSPGGVRSYDEPIVDGRFGDSFNLQNNRSVCYAVIQFRAKYSFLPPSSLNMNDSLNIGRVATLGGPFAVAAQVVNPGATPNLQTYEFSAGALDGITGGLTPLDSVLDVYLQDDTKIDFIKLWVWYAPRASCAGGVPCCVELPDGSVICGVGSGSIDDTNP